jgi:RNA polymerase sigma factor (sigma-70 family)
MPLDQPAVGYESSGVHTTASPPRTGAPRRSKRFLAFASDARLVEQMRAGSEAAFDVAYERYGKGVLSFCRHMLGSQEEAEDALQQVFASAFRDLARPGEREVRLKPWLYTIARNRCLSMLRARRDEVHVEWEPATAGLAEQVERRAELRDLLGDLGDLPAEQRAALLLAELADLSHAEIGQVLDCEAGRVKALVYRARSSLIERREARDRPCDEIREELSVLSGGSLRRSAIRYHLRSCGGCRAYRDQVKRQRALLAAALPVVPPAWLKGSVLGAGGGGAATGGLGGAATGASIAGVGVGGSTGSAVLAKAAILSVLAGGGAVATEAAIDHHGALKGSSPPAGHQASSHRDASSASSPGRAGHLRPGTDAARRAAGTSGRTHGHSAASSDAHAQPTAGQGTAEKGGQGPAAVPGSRGQGAEHNSSHADGVPHGRGPISAPPGVTPVKRGPPGTQHPAKTEHPAQTEHPPAKQHPAHPTPPPTAHNHGSKPVPATGKGGRKVDGG